MEELNIVEQYLLIVVTLDQQFSTYHTVRDQEVASNRKRQTVDLTTGQCLGDNLVNAASIPVMQEVQAGS